MYRLVFLVLPLFLISSQRLDGQVDSSSYRVFSGKIIDDSLAYAIPSVHVWNESTRMGSISNDSGEFRLKVRSQDTLVFSAIGYLSYVIVVSSSLNQEVVVRLKSREYEIGEVVVRRFRSYESFKYQVLHLDLPDSKTTELKEYIKVTSIAAALDADRERAIKGKVDGFGYSTPLGRGIDREKAFMEKTRNLKKREQVINAKFNRVLVGNITQLDGDELSEFIALCNFSEEYLYETDLYTIIEAMYVILNEYQNMIDTIPPANEL
jgi:hypothetical protein